MQQSLVCEKVETYSSKLRDEVVTFRNSVFDDSYVRSTKDEWSDYDENSVHYLVRETQSNSLVGLYRVKDFSKSNYNSSCASSLFELRNVFNVVSSALELSRACVHESYRDGTVISLLWNKVAEHLVCENVPYAFGCTSAKSYSPYDFYWLLYSGNVLPYSVSTLSSTPLLYFSKLEENEIKKKSVTTLIRAYSKQGAQFSPYPAYDSDWGTYDYFTLFETRKLVKKFKKLN